MDRTPGLRLTSSLAQRLSLGVTLAAVGLVFLLAVGCTHMGGRSLGQEAPAQSAGGVDAVVVHVVIEASCPRARAGFRGASSALVGAGRARLVSGCTQSGVDSSFTFEVHLPSSSTVVLAPGGLQAVAVDGSRASGAGEVTLRYAPEGGDFRPVSTAYGDGEDEAARLA
ncbi:hypothetical protein SAMN06264364_1362 [Quadrisphaera granulorum]|uniref:Uncharacterized protein n=1 Tax=Quadrisphaera granulorum TaxID=317664 RepID=A0A315ZPS9_9ACTN|nr:hypothetical protein [Quadrisphaera granulorum]PWJ47571.1 hypothetical protein BXY45_1362 [Quadrisphaera granulorum]SZE98701.1 hypothetical protein SAMN06264364_1362 [Quadrisphaera granulorum]